MTSPAQKGTGYLMDPVTRLRMLVALTVASVAAGFTVATGLNFMDGPYIVACAFFFLLLVLEYDDAKARAAANNPPPPDRGWD